MLEKFESFTKISDVEFQLLQTYFEQPELYSNIALSEHWKPSDKLGLRISSPINGVRYFILPCDNEYEEDDSNFIAINKPLVSDIFTHEATFLNECAFIHLLPIKDNPKNIQLVVNSEQEYMILKECSRVTDHHALNPELFPLPPLIYIDNFYQVMRYAGCDLATFIQRNPKLSSCQKDLIVKGLLDQIEKLHAKQYVHTDIKASNFCIIEPQFKITLIDYEDIIHVDSLMYNRNSSGTLPFLAPEFFKSHLIQFTKDAESLRQFEICLYIAIAKIQKDFYPHFFLVKKEMRLFASMSFFEIKKTTQVFLSLSNSNQHSPMKPNPYKLEHDLMIQNWKHHFSKETDLYALGCLLKFELNLSEDSKFYSQMQQMLHSNPQNRTFARLK